MIDVRATHIDKTHFKGKNALLYLQLNNLDMRFNEYQEKDWTPFGFWNDTRFGCAIITNKPNGKIVKMATKKDFDNVEKLKQRSVIKNKYLL